MAEPNLRWLLAWPLAVALCACGNLEGVREFAGTSAQLTSYPEVAERYVSSPTRMLTDVPPEPRFEADRAQLRDLQEQAQAQRDSLLKLHTVVTGYMAALGQLAGDDTYAIDPQVDKVEGVITAAPKVGIDAGHVQAYGSVAAAVTSWALAARQAKSVRSLIEQHGASMDKLIEAMEFVAVAMKAQLENERGQARTYHETLLSAFLVPVGFERPLSPDLAATMREQSERERQTLLNRRQAVVVWANRAYALVRAEQDRAIETAAAAVEGIRIVRAGHDDIRRNADGLGRADLKARLKKASRDLRSIRNDLKKF